VTVRQVLLVALGAGVAIGTCAAAAGLAGGDPLLGAEVALGGLGAAWLLVLVARAGPAVSGQRELERLARRERLHDHEVRLIGGARREAFVAGPIRPAIYMSRSLLELLDPGELRAVVLHEEHHRRRRDPLRSLALASWARLLGWLPPAGRWIDARLAHLEISADEYALSRGATRAAVASALLKCDQGGAPGATAFASTAEVRLRRLATGGGADDATSLPIEWVVPLSLVGAVALCHPFLA